MCLATHGHESWKAEIYIFTCLHRLFTGSACLYARCWGGHERCFRVFGVTEKVRLGLLTALLFSDLEKWTRSSLYMSGELSMSLYSLWLRSRGLMPLTRRNSWYATLKACPMDWAIIWAWSTNRKVHKKKTRTRTRGASLYYDASVPELVVTPESLKLLSNSCARQTLSVTLWSSGEIEAIFPDRGFIVLWFLRPRIQTRDTSSWTDSCHLLLDPELPGTPESRAEAAFFGPSEPPHSRCLRCIPRSVRAGPSRFPASTGRWRHRCNFSTHPYSAGCTPFNWVGFVFKQVPENLCSALWPSAWRWRGPPPSETLYRPAETCWHRDMVGLSRQTLEFKSVMILVSSGFVI